MKFTRCFSLVLLVGCVFTITASGQVSARRITKRAVDANAAENRALNHALSTPAQQPAPTATPPRAPAAVPAPVLTNTVPEKTPEQKAQLLQKTIEFQKKRAAAGAPTAQYDLGMRYLNGDGLEKNPELAQKWLKAAAANGNSQAAKKLQELKQQ
jgi:TPR repeat protein